MPPGFQSGSMQSQCWKTPVRFRFAVRSDWRRAGDLHREEVLGAARHMLGDVELVREEIALGVTKVGAIEPDVAQIEDAVEHEPAAHSGTATAIVR